MLDEVVHDIMESLPQELAARQNFLDGLNQPAQAFGFNLMFGFDVADAVGGGLIAHLQLFENHILFRMMAALGIVLKILDNSLQYLVIRLLAAIEDFQFMLQNKEQLIDVPMLFEQNLNDIDIDRSRPRVHPNKIVIGQQ